MENQHGTMLLDCNFVQLSCVGLYCGVFCYGVISLVSSKSFEEGFHKVVVIEGKKSRVKR